MNNIVLQKTWVQGRPVVVDNLLGTAFTGEAGAHTFKIRGVDAAQETVTISGTITGKLLAANNATISLSGSIEDGCAVVTLTDECYDVPGRFIFSVYATSGSTTLCLYCAVGNVLRTDSQVIAYPTESLPNITSLMADLEQILDGWPADYSQLQSDVSSLKSAFEQDYIPWDVNGDGKYILANGTIEGGSGAANFHYSALIDAEQNTPYTFTYLYTGQFACRIHGYNSSGIWVKQLGYFVSTNTTAYNTINFVIDDASIVYFRISIHKYLASYLTLYNGNNTVYSDAVEHKSSRLSNVPTATANAIAKCVQSYIDHNDNFIYGQDGTATKYNSNGYIDSGTGKYRIDCSTFALLVIMGCDYDHSMYKTTDTNVFGAMGYGYNPFAGYAYPWNNQKLYGTYTWQMCYEYTKAGYTFDVINRNFGNVQPGDLIFWGSTANGVQGNYKRIHHVDVVVARYGTDDCVVADAGTVPIQLKRAKQRVESDDIAIVARLPLGIAQTTEKYHMYRHYETPVSQLVITFPTTIKHYSPCAMKVKIHQTAASGSFSVSGVYLAGETLGSSTNGETFELTKTGYFSADAARVQINATGAEILDIWFGTPAAVVDWSDENYKQFEHDVVITWDAASSGKYIGSDGSIGSSGSFHYSDLIPCIQGNGRILLTYSGSSVGTRLHGYDSTGTWVKQLGNVEGMVGNAELNFTVNDTSIKYVRISCPKSASVKMWQTNDPYIDYTQWYGKKWYAYGTSLTSATKGKYADYLASMSGMILNNKGIEGGGITNNGGTSTGQVKTAIMNTSDGKTESDLITWEIGANEGSTADSENDLFDTSDNTFCGLFNQCIRYLMENTSAQIVVMYSPSGKTDPDTVQWYHKRKEFVRKLCQINGVYFIGEPNVFGYGRMKGGAYNVDNIHQNDLGGYNLACFMWSKLKDIPCWYDSIPEGASNA